MQKRNRKLGNYPSLMIIISLTAALFLVAFSGWIALTTKQFLLNIKQNLEIQVYLDKSISVQQRDSVRQVINLKKYISTTNEANTIKFISKESTAERVFKEISEDYKSLLGENPYRDAFSIKIKEEYLTEQSLKNIKTDLEQINGIFEADYAKDYVDKINSNANKAYLFITSIVILLLIAIVILINNTIRLALYSQRFIIHSMQLVGATDWFIQKPFLWRGAMQGLISGLLAAGFLMIFQNIANSEIEALASLHDLSKMLFLSIGVVILGILIGLVSTFQAMYKYLRTDLDDLY